MRSLESRVELVKSGDGAVMLVKDTGQYIQLNSLGEQIVRSLIEGRTSDECVDEIAAQYKTEQSVVAKDVRAFIANLTEAGVLI